MGGVSPSSREVEFTCPAVNTLFQLHTVNQQMCVQQLKFSYNIAVFIYQNMPYYDEITQRIPRKISQNTTKRTSVICIDLFGHLLNRHEYKGNASPHSLDRMTVNTLVIL